MRYSNIVSAEFLSRTNRFVAQVKVDGREVSAHVKNTGRCLELLVPGATVYLEDYSGRLGTRKLHYDLVAVDKGGLLINMDSQAPNKVVGEALQDGSVKLPGMAELSFLRPETVWGDSRFDFFVRDVNGMEGFAEVKGVTLETDGAASFPDAPTQRGIKHLNELIAAKKEGFAACVLFVVQMAGVKYFAPNDERHAAFGEALRYAAQNGVDILAYECAVTPDALRITASVPVRL